MHPLSLPQQAIYLDALARGATTKHNMGGAIVIRGPIDVDLFRKGLEFAVNVHDVQRMRLCFEGELATQEFLPEGSCSSQFEVFDFSSHANPFQSTLDWVRADFARPMRLDQYPLHRDVLFRLAEEVHFWYPQFHHIACDAFGHSLIASTVATAYSELHRSGRLPGPKCRSYVAFLEDDHDYAASNQYRADVAFWKSRFVAMPEPLPFTTRKGGLTRDVLRTERITLTVQRLVYDAVVARAKQVEVTPFQLLLACLFGYLSRISGCADIVIGTPILNRSNRAFRCTAGMFMNMMPLRARIEPGESVFGLAQQVRAETKACYRHQRLPFGETLRHCRALDGFWHSVFDVTLVYRKLNYDVKFGDSPMRVATLDTGARDETFSIEIDEYNATEDVNFFFNYNPQLILAAEAEQMAQAFQMLLGDIALHGDRAVREIRLYPEPVGLVAARRRVPLESTVIDEVERRVAEGPREVALVCGGERVTRAELAMKSNRIASFLANICEVTPEQPIGVLCNRDAEWVTAAIAIMKTGSAYLPLDPELPRERLRWILQDSGCRLLLVGAAYATDAFDGIRTIPVVEASRYLGAVTARAPLLQHSLAYVIYTSGTTGQPKGILVEHGSLANTILELIRGWTVTERDRVLAFAAPMFDASIVDLFIALASGARLVIASKDEILDANHFLELLERECVTVATLPPTYLSALGRVDLTSLRMLITAGEAANPADVAHHVRRLTYVNAYGPTEATVCASYLVLPLGTDVSGGRVSIGRALGNTQMLVLDAELRPLPVGAIGELCIGGAGLARGYLNRARLTAERFVKSPLCRDERLYRTGDLGRELADGNFEFLGRLDTQVKIRGYRVELGEVESVLKSYSAVETAVVTAWTRLPGAAELVAYVVARDSFEPRALRRFLVSKLPGYMVPSRWLRIAQVPLNSSGKVDDKALPDPHLAEVLGSERGEQTAPRTSLEVRLIEIWREVLKIESIGVEDNFFEVGGHSLSALRLLSRIYERLAARVEVADFFARPTIEGLASCIERSATAERIPIPRAEPIDTYPLSNAQGRIWVLSQLDGGLAAYNMPLALDIVGALDLAALEHALCAVISRHESLRTCFVYANDGPRQKILPAKEVRFKLVAHDLVSNASAEEGARLRLRAEFARPFDLSQPPLLRAVVFQIAESRWLLSLVVHHIVADGWSLDVLLRDLACFYAHALGDTASVPTNLPLQYRDYSQWMAERLQHRALDRESAFWVEKLARPLPVLSLPTDRTRPMVLGFTGTIEEFPLPFTAHLDFKLFCAERHVTPFMVLLASVFALLNRYSSDEDIIIGTPVANRDRIDLEDQIGLYVNTLALRVQVAHECTLTELLERVRAVVLEAQEHRDYPFDTLVRELKIKRSTDRNPLFDVMVVMQDAVRHELRAPGIHGTQYSIPVGVSVFDLTFHFSQDGLGTRLAIEYNTAMFERPRMKRLSHHLDRLIEAIVSQPAAKLADVDILPIEERRTIIGKLAEGAALPVPDGTVIDWFAARARQSPSRIAVVFGKRSLTYAELSAASARLAARLLTAQIVSGSVVALVVARSEWMVAGVLGIMASGAACLLVDATQPPKRIECILVDSGCRLVVSDQSIALRGTFSVIPLCESGEPSDMPLSAYARLSDVAYVTYTSGSTGTPNGSLIGHRSLSNLVNALGPVLYDALPSPANELLLASIGFDVAIKQLFGSLTRGNTLVVADDALRHDPRALMADLVRLQIHLIDLTPSLFAALLAQGFAALSKPSLRTIVLGSESLPFALIEAFAKDPINRNISLYNFYGPSECTVEALCCRLDVQVLAERKVAPIGRPIANSRVYLLNPDSTQPVPIGISGEICLGGVPLGRGYLNQPALTVARFISDPFRPGERLYRTGDIGRFASDGTVEYLGRVDGQLEIRGYRIEPREVEYHLLQHPDVAQAIVEGRLDSTGNMSIVAYLVPASSCPTVKSLRAFLKRKLPDYMLPAGFAFLEAVPLLPSGKLNRGALPELVHKDAGQSYQAPRDPLERRLVQLWEVLLPARPIGVEDDFFELGGHSLLAVRLIAEIDAGFGKRLPMSRFFEFPTIQGIAALLRNYGAAIEPSCLVRIRSEGSRTPLFFLPGGFGVTSYLNPLAKALDPKLPFMVFQARGLEGSSSPHSSIESMAAHYVDLVLEVQSQGPYFLAGHSTGGLVAFAMAQLLLARGQRMGRLVVVDSLPPETISAIASEGATDDTSLILELTQILELIHHRAFALKRNDLEDMSVERQLAALASHLASTNLLPACNGQDHLRRLLTVYKTNLQMCIRYSPKLTFPLPIALLRATEAIAGHVSQINLDAEVGWNRYSRDPVTVHLVPGNHVTMMLSPHVEVLAQVLETLIE